MTNVSSSFIIASMGKTKIISSAQTFGERLKTLRENKGISQQAVGDLFGIGRISVSNWERGKNPPTTDKLERLAEFFGVSVDWLLGREKANFTNVPLKGTLATVPLISWVQAGQ